MWDLVGNPEDRFSYEAHIKWKDADYAVVHIEAFGLEDSVMAICETCHEKDCCLYMGKHQKHQCRSAAR